jgi:hypothetical protein
MKPNHTMNASARKHLRTIGPGYNDRDASQSINAHYKDTPSSAIVLANPISNKDAYGDELVNTLKLVTQH